MWEPKHLSKEVHGPQHRLMTLSCLPPLRFAPGQESPISLTNRHCSCRNPERQRSGGGTTNDGTRQPTADGGSLSLRSGIVLAYTTPQRSISTIRRHQGVEW